MCRKMRLMIPGWSKNKSPAGEAIQKMRVKMQRRALPHSIELVIFCTSAALRPVGGA
jgi:hypothetical protein